MKFLVTIIIVISYINLYSNEYIDNAYIYFQKGDYKKAISILKQYENNILNEEDSKTIAKYYYGLGRSYLELGIIDSAFKYQLKSYNIKKTFNLNDNLNLSYNDLGRLYNKMGLQHKSIFFLNNAIKINLANKNYELLFGNYLNLGNAYNDLRFVDSAESYYLKSLEISENQDKIERGKIYNNLAVLYQESKEFDKSYQFSEKALNMINIENKYYYQWKTNYELSKIYMKMPFDKEVFYMYYNFAKKSQSIITKCDALFKLSLLEINSQTKSLNFLKQSIELLESIKNYNGAIIVLEEYERQMGNNNIDSKNNTFISSYKLNLLNLNTRRLAKEYGDELKINQESYKQISNLKSELIYANFGFYGLLTLIIISITSIITIVLWVRKKKIIQILIQKYRDNNNYNNKLSNSAKSDLGKLTFLIDKRLSYEGNELLFNTLDSLINNVNNIDSQFISNNIKEAECQILQHQQITTGSETH